MTYHGQKTLIYLIIKGLKKFFTRLFFREILLAEKSIFRVFAQFMLHGAQINVQILKTLDNFQ
jgi:hypothetical protein